MQTQRKNNADPETKMQRQNPLVKCVDGTTHRVPPYTVGDKRPPTLEQTQEEFPLSVVIGDVCD